MSIKISDCSIAMIVYIIQYQCMCACNIRVVPTPSSLTLTTSNDAAFAVVGSNVTFICTLVLNSVMLGSENALLIVDVQLSNDETTFALPSATMTGTTFTYTTVVSSFGRNDSGNYTCTATVRPKPTATYLTGNETLSSTFNIRAGI